MSNNVEGWVWEDAETPGQMVLMPKYGGKPVLWSQDKAWVREEDKHLIAAAPELLAALKELVYTTEAMSAYIPPHNAKIREEYVTRTHRAWQCIRKAEWRGE